MLAVVPWSPHLYQKRAAKFLLERAVAALFLDPGLGKTAIVLAALKVLKKKGLFGKTLVIAPLRVCYSVWPAEVAKWKDFGDFKVAILHGKDKEKALASDADLYLINPEGLEWLLKPTTDVRPSFGDGTHKRKLVVDLARFKKFKFEILVVDEISKFKHAQTKRFRLLREVTPTFRYRWGLTGSPAANGLMDLYAQAYILDGGRSLGAYFTHFRFKYFRPIGKQGWLWVLKAGAEEAIYERLAPLALRMSAEEYLALPELITTNIEVDLPPDARILYDQIEEILFAVLEEENYVVTAANVAASLTKCRQIASGGVYVDVLMTQLNAKKWSWLGTRGWHPIHAAKTDALTDLFDEMQGQPLLIAYEFEHDLARIREALGEDVPVIGGSTDAADSSEYIRRWNLGELPALVVHPKSAAHGLNLQEVGHHIVWYSPTWDYELYDQLIRRIWRQGSTASKVFVYRIVARSTIDEVILSALASKERCQNAFFSALELRAKMKKRA